MRVFQFFFNFVQIWFNKMVSSIEVQISRPFCFFWDPYHSWVGWKVKWKEFGEKCHCVPHITPPGTKSPINLLSQTHRQKNSESLEMHCKSWRKQSNGILFQKLFWPSVRKICSCEREELWKFYAEDWKFTKILRSPEQFI